MTAKLKPAPMPEAVLIIQTGHQSAPKLTAWKFYDDRREPAQPAAGDFDIVAKWCERQGYQRRGALVNGQYGACVWIAKGQDLAATIAHISRTSKLDIKPATCTYYTGERRIGTTRTRKAIMTNRAKAGVGDTLTDLAIVVLESWDMADAATLAQRRAGNAMPPADWQPSAGQARAYGLVTA